MSAERKPVRLSETPDTAAWFAADSSDGGAHYGELHTSGTVHAACGAVFVPATSIMTGKLLRWRRPVDEAHACADCRKAAPHAEPADDDPQ